LLDRYVGRLGLDNKNRIAVEEDNIVGDIALRQRMTLFTNDRTRSDFFVRMALKGISRKLGCVSKGIMNFCPTSLSVEKSYSGIVSRLTTRPPPNQLLNAPYCTLSGPIGGHLKTFSARPE
jgi:hypothetical protein